MSMGNPNGFDSISIEIDTSLMGSQLSNLPPDTDISGYIDYFSITDGNTPPPFDNGGFAAADFMFLPPPTVDIGTDAAGNITSWNVSEGFFVSYPSFTGENPYDFYCEYSISTMSGSGGSEDQTALTLDNDAGLCPVGGNVNGNPGTWFMVPVSTTSEPGGYLLLGSGLFGLVSLSAWSATRNPHKL